MENVLLNIQDIGLLVKIITWVIGILMTIIGSLCGFLLWYVIRVFKKAESLDGKISKIHYETIALREANGQIFSALHSSEKSVWDELIKLRRSVVSGTLVLRRRKQEVDKIVADTRRAENRMDKHEKILDASVQVFRKHRAEFQLIRTKLINLEHDLTLVTEEKPNSINGKGKK